MIFQSPYKHTEWVTFYDSDFVDQDEANSVQYHEKHVNIMFGELQKVIDWCKQSCNERWKVRILHTAGENPGEYKFLFQSKEDFIKFLMFKS